jgi:hypothetical protein
VNASGAPPADDGDETRDAVKTTAATPGASSIGPDATSVPPYEEVRTEIELLRRLRDDGTISQEDFERELSRVLDASSPSASTPASKPESR